MTDEILKYLRALKPEIDKRMGPIQNGDVFYCLECEKIGTAEYIVKCDPFTDKCVPYLGTHYGHSRWLYVPHPMPMPGVPEERTLWGMIDWRFHYLDDEGDNGSIRITGDDFVTIGRPYLALLKALAHQCEVEVK